ERNQQIFKETTSGLARNYYAMVDQQEWGLGSTFRALVENSTAGALIASGGIEQLHADWVRTYADLKKDRDLHLFRIYDDKGNNLVHLDDPTRHGNPAAGQIYNNAKKSQALETGVELSAKGEITLR